MNFPSRIGCQGLRLGLSRLPFPPKATSFPTLAKSAHNTQIFSDGTKASWSIHVGNAEYVENCIATSFWSAMIMDIGNKSLLFKLEAKLTQVIIELLLAAYLVAGSKFAGLWPSARLSQAIMPDRCSCTPGSSLEDELRFRGSEHMNKADLLFPVPAAMAGCRNSDLEILGTRSNMTSLLERYEGTCATSMGILYSSASSLMSLNVWIDCNGSQSKTSLCQSERIALRGTIRGFSHDPEAPSISRNCVAMMVWMLVDGFSQEVNALYVKLWSMRGLNACKASSRNRASDTPNCWLKASHTTLTHSLLYLQSGGLGE
ncbi:uncharacterized protein MYCFIDRAFT_171846 [Pseudocercospora fijiensis CIRAD86]|uniref:Uncharacterized protein n=1 Tax=Pseudocercospora fijiensis (strain CIRAD86) TaxID=383855 RepID=M3B9T8_PSEFD|nr:uncharacterized protein MYCFIDRAFT_171846 [Pseudocercospora fijiensis CIRAD86]EME86023.1 hypothetical protein MYCFIDRAFT_171846 [Pseudocercospora fijiensis CIRAD86]